MYTTMIHVREQSSRLLRTVDDDAEFASEKTKDGQKGRSNWMTSAVNVSLLYSLRHLLPSFILPSSRKQHIVNRSKLSPTAYMDGVRGVACFGVFLCHILPAHTDHAWEKGGTISNGYHATPDDVDLIQLPFVRALYSDDFMVWILFILAGYVLTLRPLQYVHRGEHNAVFNNLSGSVFCRGFSLFLPAFVMTFLTTFLVYGNLLGPNQRGYWTELPQESLYLQLKDTWIAQNALIDPFHEDYEKFRYFTHLWTLHAEFAGSMFIFLLMVAFAKLVVWVRVCLNSLIAIYCFRSDKGVFGVFVLGMILAELAIIRQDPTSSNFRAFRRLYRKIPRRATRCLWTGTFIVSWYFGSFPQSLPDKTPGFQTMASIVPYPFSNNKVLRERYWYFWVASLMLLSLENCPSLQYPFTTSVAQYMGKISFSFYLVHIAMAFSFNRLVINCISVDMPKGTLLWLLEITILTFLTTWAGDLFWRAVDVRSVMLTRRIHNWCMVAKQS